MTTKPPTTVKEFIEAARAAGHDSLGIANDPEALGIIDKMANDVAERVVDRLAETITDDDDFMGLIKSVSIRESEERCYKWCENLTCDEPRFSHWVVIHHEEGTQYLFNYAFLVKDPEDEDYVWAITEHQGYHVFCKDDLSEYIELARWEAE